MTGLSPGSLQGLGWMLPWESTSRKGQEVFRVQGTLMPTCTGAKLHG